MLFLRTTTTKIPHKPNSLIHRCTGEGIDSVRFVNAGYLDCPNIQPQQISLGLVQVQAGCIGPTITAYQHLTEIP